ncbi:geranyl diphosphate/farnesyl diphosphate synthase [Gammaproteobacteria bacterium]
MVSNLSTVESFVVHCQKRVEEALCHWLPTIHAAPTNLHQAMHYAVLEGGKRIRPLLVYATGRSLGISSEALDAPACAIELIHAYSLVHDDLPLMDNDDLRRGKPTCHKMFGEVTALLAGDALQSLAFHILAHAPRTLGEDRLRMVETLALSAGSRGMAGGQAMDLAAEGREITLPELELIHIHKTGALIRASVLFGIYACPEMVGTKRHEYLDHYAKCIGLAFQIQDDVLDVEGDTRILGKRQGADAAHDKSTYPSLMGLSAAKERAAELQEEALDSLAIFDDSADVLRWLATYIVRRSH